MTDKQRVARGAEEDDDNLIEVRVGALVDRPSLAAEVDVFAKPIDELRKLSGINPSVKRNVSRELSKFNRGSDGAQSKKNEIEAVGTGYNWFGVITPPYNQDYLAALYEKSAPHASAIRAKVKNIVGLGYDFIETDATNNVLDRAGDDEEKLARIRRKLTRGKQDLHDWLDACNEEDTFTETLMKVWTDYEATGNGYFEIGRTVGGDIGYIGHIPATTVRVRRDRDGFVQIISNRVVFFRNFGDKKTANPVGTDTKPNEIIHLKKYTPTHGYYGITDAISALNSIVGNEFAARFNLDYFENKAVPRYVVIVKGGNLSPRSEGEILEFFQSSMKGKNHRTLYVPLPADEDNRKVSFEMKPVEAGVQDASFTNYRSGNLNEILMSHQVPITKVMYASDMALAAASDLDKTFKEQVCRPEQAVLEKKFSRVVKEKTDVFMLKFNELSLTDESTQATIDESRLRMQTVVPNEVRARLGMPGLKGGDTPVELHPQQKAEQTTQASGNRQRDQQRQQTAPDSPSSPAVRVPKGEGRQQS